jgi:hypothetical protein
MIIKNIPSTFVNDIQALVLFDRLSSSSQISPVGLIIELYNSINDPTLIEPLATTTIISTKEDNYRYNFPSIGKYGGEFATLTSEMTTNIISDTIATTTDATLSTFEPEININSKIVFDVSGSITLPIIGDVEDAIQGKQDSLTGGTNINIVDDVVSCDLVGSTNIDITDGVISTTGLQEELSAGTNISIVGDVVSCDLTGSTNIDITGGVISTSSVLDGVISQNGDDILSNTNALSSVQTQVDALIDLFGGGVNFRAYTLSSATFSAGNILIYDNESYDTENSYDTSTGIYTIVCWDLCFYAWMVCGKWFNCCRQSYQKKKQCGKHITTKHQRNKYR